LIIQDNIEINKIPLIGRFQDGTILECMRLYAGFEELRTLTFGRKRKLIGTFKRVLERYTKEEGRRFIYYWWGRMGMKNKRLMISKYKSKIKL